MGHSDKHQLHSFTEKKLNWLVTTFFVWYTCSMKKLDYLPLQLLQEESINKKWLVTGGQGKFSTPHGRMLWCSYLKWTPTNWLVQMRVGVGWSGLDYWFMCILVKLYSFKNIQISYLKQVQGLNVGSSSTRQNPRTGKKGIEFRLIAYVGKECFSSKKRKWVFNLTM